MRGLILFTVMLVCCTGLRAQYTLAGKIEYEKKMNVHAILKDEVSDESDNSWYERVRSSTPKFTTTYFEMVFDSAHALYKPAREIDTKGSFFSNPPANDNIVLTDFGAKKVSAVKNVFEQKFLVQDSMRKIDWRVKDEIRIISDYKCRKAVGRICDSVYVVAFYTEDIPSAGGPEMFGNLPGMILELAIPRLHTTWVANKIELTPPKQEDFTIPEKGKKVTEKELFDAIQKSMKDWGKWGRKYVWWTVL